MAAQIDKLLLVSKAVASANAAPLAAPADVKRKQRQAKSGMPQTARCLGMNFKPRLLLLLLLLLLVLFSAASSISFPLRSTKSTPASFSSSSTLTPSHRGSDG